MKKTLLLLAALLLFSSMVLAEDNKKTTTVSITTFDNEQKLLVQNGMKEKDAEDILRAMVRARFSEDQVRRAAEEMVGKGAAKSRITTGAIKNKIHEGIAKGAGPERILKATRRVRNRYEYSLKLAEQLKPQKRERVGQAIADCLVAGLSREDAKIITSALHQRAQQLPQKKRQRALTTETMGAAKGLVRQGISSDNTSMILQNALHNGYDEEGMSLLRKNLAKSPRASLTQTVHNYNEAIKKGVEAHDLQASVNSGQGKSGQSGSKGGKSGAGSGQSGSAGSGNNGGGNGSGGTGGGGNSGNDSGGSGNGSGHGNGGGQRS